MRCDWELELRYILITDIESVNATIEAIVNKKQITTNKLRYK